MARDDRQRRRGDGRRATSQHRRLTHWRPWHHGDDEGRAWADAALLLELGQERLVADAVMVAPALSGHDGGQSAVSAGPSSTSGSNEGRR